MRNGRSGRYNGHNRTGVFLSWSSRYREHGIKLLKEKDYEQASEKLWGAATQFVKAVAEKHGWLHDGHAELFKIVNKISKELDDQEILILFNSVNALHTNFYEHWLTPDEVRAGAEAVGRLIERLKPLLNPHTK